MIKEMIYGNLTKSIVHWLLLVLAITYLITGYGITQPRIVENLTFGLLTKNLAFRIHDAIDIPFITLLILHVVLPSILKHFKLK